MLGSGSSNTLLLATCSMAVYYLLLGSTLVVLPSLAQNSHQDFVAAHNAARARVGVPPVAWNDAVAAYASKYAQERAGDCELQHSPGRLYGENIADGTGAFSGEDAMKLWLAEKPDYDYKTNSCVGGEDCLHYTQIVWRDTTHIGCARVQCDNGWSFVTCNYDPPGNMEGERPY